ncbi:hypothetical protein ACFZDJ_51115 [Streptomyces sp. NPDC007896]|uniref:hypothetical protein n=1 Tax=Streptomyces sp. NPDC007896 TaxID=3364784 RepID=UPI0036E088E7
MTTSIDEGPVAMRSAVTAVDERAVLANAASEEEWMDFLGKKRAAPVNQVTISAVLEGGRSKVRVVDMRPRIREKREKWTGAYFTPATAGEVETIPLTADLDRRRPAFSTTGKTSENYFRQRQIELSRGEITTISMTLTAQKASYEFDILVTVMADDKAKEVIIHPEGESAFRLTGRESKASNYRQVFEEVGGAWVQAPPGQWCVKLSLLKNCS